jgi:hypothetical protein
MVCKLPYTTFEKQTNISWKAGDWKMNNELVQLLALLGAMLAMFSPLILMLISDDTKAFIRVHYPNTPKKDLPKSFLDIDLRRRNSETK